MIKCKLSCLIMFFGTASRITSKSLSLKTILLWLCITMQTTDVKIIHINQKNRNVIIFLDWCICFASRDALPSIPQRNCPDCCPRFGSLGPPLHAGPSQPNPITRSQLLTHFVTLTWCHQTACKVQARVIHSINCSHLNFIF